MLGVSRLPVRTGATSSLPSPTPPRRVFYSTPRDYLQPPRRRGRLQSAPPHRVECSLSSSLRYGGPEMMTSTHLPTPLCRVFAGVGPPSRPPPVALCARMIGSLLTFLSSMQDLYHVVCAGRSPYRAPHRIESLKRVEPSHRIESLKRVESLNHVESPHRVECSLSTPDRTGFISRLLHISPTPPHPTVSSVLVSESGPSHRHSHCWRPRPCSYRRGLEYSGPAAIAVGWKTGSQLRRFEEKTSPFSAGRMSRE
jgi:hypothetical protein